MNAILMAAIVGAAGGAIGGGAAWVLGKVLGRPPGWLKLLPVFCVVFALSLGRAFQSSADDGMMTEIDKLTPVQAVKSHYPDDYRRLETGVRRARSDDEVRRAVDETLISVIIRQKPKADAASAAALYQVTRAEGRALQKSDPEGCAAFLDGRPAPGLARVQTPALRAQDREATARLLEQAATRPAAPAVPMSVDDLAQLSLKAIASFPEAKQNLVIDVLRSERDPRPGAESRAMCDFNLALADVILARPPAEAGALVRGIWAMK